MTFEIWSLYVATVLALMSTPGPSQLLMLSNSSAHGFNRAWATGAGDLTANALQMLAAGLGLAAVIAASAHALGVIKWAGVAYLLWLGVRMILRANVEDPHLHGAQKQVPLSTLWLQGFLTSAANPKAVVFFAALFPQFIQADGPLWSQLLILSATYITIDGCFLSAYGISAGWISARFKGAAKARIERLGGVFMIIAAGLLGLKSIART